MKYSVGINDCRCHPETCNDWAIFDGDQKPRRLTMLQFSEIAINVQTNEFTKCRHLLEEGFK